MKASRTILTVLLVVLMVAGWFSFVTSVMKTNASYNASLNAAEGYVEKALYQKAITEFNNALAIRETQEVREALVDTYELAYNDGTVSFGGYTAQLATAAELYPEELAYWERLLELEVGSGSHKNAYEVIKDIRKAGVSSERIEELSRKVLYSFSISGKVYQQVLHTPGVCFTVCDDDLWGVLQLSGEEFRECNYAYISPVSQGAYAVYQTDRDTRLLDGSLVAHAYVDLELSEARAYGDGYLPVKGAVTWRYYDLANGEYVLERYDDASAFVNGVAAVLEDDVWHLIDKEGNVVCDTGFSDVKLYDNGSYTYKGIMIAAEDGKYGIYDAAGIRLCGFSCDDADVYMGSWIACKDGDLWGYVNTDGEIIIEPQYETARSFSGGLAAVEKDGRWGFINGEGHVVIEPQFTAAGYFTGSGKCFVCRIEDYYSILSLNYPEEV